MKKSISLLPSVKLFVIAIILIILAGISFVCIEFSRINAGNAQGYSQEILSSEMQCGGEYGVDCEDIKDGFREAVPNYRIKGLSSEDRINGVPDAYQIIALNVSALGEPGDTEIEGLSAETKAETKNVTSDMPFKWNAGVLIIDGSAQDGKINICVANKNDIDAIKKHLYLGLSKDDIKFVNEQHFLNITSCQDDNSVSKNAKLSITKLANDWKITRDQIEYPEKYNWPGTKKQLLGSGLEISTKNGVVTVLRNPTDWVPTTSEALAHGFKLNQGMNESKTVVTRKDGEWKFENSQPDSDFQYFSMNTYFTNASVIDYQYSEFDTSYEQNINDFSVMSLNGGKTENSTHTPKADTDTRMNDTGDLAGGDRIDGSSGSCTSGVAVVGKATGNVYETTAGHCGNNGDSFSNAGREYGDLTNKDDYPTYDTARLHGSRVYNQFFFMDGVCSKGSTVCAGKDCIAGSDCGSAAEQYREIVGAGDTTVGTVYCVSGSYTKSVCNAKVVERDVAAYFNGNSKPTLHLDRYDSTNNEMIAQQGDSGSPVYTRNPDNRRANFKGWVSGGNNNGKTMYASMYYPNADYLKSNIFYKHTLDTNSNAILPKAYTDNNFIKPASIDRKLPISLHKHVEFSQLVKYENKPDLKYGYSKIPWTYVNTDENGNILISAFGNKLDGVEVVETDDYVIIGAIHKKTNPNNLETFVAYNTFGTVNLKKPLGDRPVYHAQFDLAGTEDMVIKQRVHDNNLKEFVKNTLY